MQFLNHMIKAASEAGLSGTLYKEWNNAAPIIAYIFYFFYCKKYQIGRIKGLLAVLVFNYYLSMVASAVLWAEAGFTASTIKNVVVAFAFAPLAPFLLSKILRTPWRAMSDMLAPIPFILHGFYRIGCIFMGCCRGYPSEWGLYNQRLDQICAPVQLFEALVSFAIVIYCLVRGKKKHYVADGKALPIGLIVYGIARFISEFFHDNDKIAFGCSSLAFHSLFMCLVAASILFFLRKTDRAVNESEFSEKRSFS